MLAAAPPPEPRRAQGGEVAALLAEFARIPDAGQVRRHHTPAVLPVLRDLIRSVLKLVGWANIAAARRAHADRHRVLALHVLT
ncbi:hypothetical protein AB0N14_15815 [Streptomyces sp. NPDC051104]|uniref:hypothetical protein n=1 Tax=Streptomyces sp. NPDC051104 TaxID=3155044 RepID=UPI003437BEEC